MVRFFHSFDTTSILLSFATGLLHTSPEAKAKLHVELDTTLPEDPAAFTQDTVVRFDCWPMQMHVMAWCADFSTALHSCRCGRNSAAVPPGVHHHQNDPGPRDTFHRSYHPCGCVCVHPDRIRAP